MAEGEAPAEGKPEEGKISKFYRDVKEGVSNYLKAVDGVFGPENGIAAQAKKEAEYIKDTKAPMVKAAKKGLDGP
ncbi:MAG: hypothetical protein EPN97_14120 [Alphaproteobacteria bacterium]|nr:MAG: hypothetical protein EPN97_14120 [Alphaproteobacteria bacterium]